MRVMQSTPINHHCLPRGKHRNLPLSETWSSVDFVQELGELAAVLGVIVDAQLRLLAKRLVELPEVVLILQFLRTDQGTS